MSRHTGGVPDPWQPNCGPGVTKYGEFGHAWHTDRARTPPEALLAPDSALLAPD